jgi:lipid-A-disaccharide synthase
VAGPCILISAGEVSGDIHGAALARALRSRWPDARLFGLGGPLMAAEGVELLAELRDLAVMGFVEVAARVPFFLRLLRRVQREMRARGTNLVIPIDYPGYNLRLTRAASRDGIPVLYYIAPQVWAWHRSRARFLARYADRLAVILPFEEEYFRRFGADARFVGHPLLDGVGLGRGIGIGMPAGESEGWELALLPGSREQEVRRHLELFQQAADRLITGRPGLRAAIAAAPTLPPGLFAGARFPVVRDARSLLLGARAALVKSGTGTLEAALCGTPMVIAYRTHPITFRIARRLVGVEHIGLVNLIAGRRAFPEFVQDEATPEALAAALRPFLADGAPRAEALAHLERIRRGLASPGDGYPTVADRVASLAAELVRSY